MNLSCGSRTIKYLIFTFNFFFVITGIILIAVGASIHAYYTQYNYVLNNQYFSLPNLLIATGTLIFVICFLGCYGAMKNSWIMLMIFSVFLGVIFIFEFSAGIAGYILRDKTTTYLETEMYKAMNQYNTSSESSHMWDDIQKTFQCCGVHSYTDWKNVMNSNDLPITCCPPKQGQSGSFYCNADVPNQITTTPSSGAVTTSASTEATSSTTATTKSPAPTGKSIRKVRQASQLQENATTTTNPYNVGCEAAFGKWVKSHAVDIGAICFTLAVLQLVGIGFSCHLSKQLKNSYYST